MINIFEWENGLAIPEQVLEKLHTKFAEAVGGGIMMTTQPSIVH